MNACQAEIVVAARATQPDPHPWWLAPAWVVVAVASAIFSIMLPMSPEAVDAALITRPEHSAPMQSQAPAQLAAPASSSKQSPTS